MPTPKRKDILLNGIVVGSYESTGDEKKDIEITREILKKKSLWKKKSMIDMMFNQAQSFAYTANHLFEKDIRNHPRKFHSFAPFVVNAAFSIEIYLKTLHHLHGKKIKGHSLTDLYKILDTDYKSIINRIAEETRNLYQIEQEKGFDYYLSSLDRAFVKWRYIYERDVEKIYFLPTIYVMQVLDKACVKIRKNQKTI
ncbi:MAG TPA: hypothetical protein DHV36_01960 [Desulfobacteraceae bacterium]|nr:hypothetical protein [Desulfobacteraceae bacterium]